MAFGANLDAEQLLQQLESCAQILMSSSNVTQQELASAQAVFADFQKADQPFELCRTILERSSCSPYVKFQAASCLKSGIIRDWDYLKVDNRKFTLLTYLLEYVASKPNLEAFVRGQLLMVAAILLKRIGIEEPAHSPFRPPPDDMPSIVRDIVKDTLAMQKANASSTEEIIHRMYIATSFLLALLNEYSSSTRASDFGLPWIKHLEAKKRFEDMHLKSVFESTLESIKHILCENPNLSQKLMEKDTLTIDLVYKLLQLLESVFMWKFELITIISSQYANHIDSIETPIFQPPAEWRSILLDEQLANFIFYLYTQIRSLNETSIVHTSLQCLSQFSTLTGCVLNDPKMSLRFCNNLTTGMIKLIHMNQSTGYKMSPHEVTPLTQVFYRICLHIQDRDTLRNIEKALMCQALQSFTSFTCDIMKASAAAESNKYQGDDKDAYKQGVENLCDGWAIILQATSKLSSAGSSSKTFDPSGCGGLISARPWEIIQVISSKYSSGDGSSSSQGFNASELLDLPLLKSCTNEIYKTYMQCHLTQPQGFRELIDDSDEIEEYEEDDLVAFNDQLHSIGSIGRIDLASSINCLSQMLLMRTNHLQVLMEKIASCGKQSVNGAEWSAVNEDIHWLIMITTWTLSESNWFSERDLIPEEVMKLSIAASADINTTVQVLTRLISSSKGFEPVASDEESSRVDPVVMLILFVFKLSKLEIYIIENNLQLFSPQVSSTISTFISRFMSSYLMPNESDYTDLSMCIITAFGQDTATSMLILDFVIEHILTKMFAWSTDASVKESSAQTLVAFVYNAPERAKYVAQSSQIAKLLSLAANQQLSVLSVASRKCIYQYLVLLAGHKPSMFDEIFGPLTQKYQQIRPTINSVNDMTDQKSVILVEWLECLIGITNGTSSTNISTVWFKFVSHIYLTELSTLFNLCRNCPLVIEALLEFMNAVSHKLLCYLTRAESAKYYEATLSTLWVYTDHNKSRVTREVSADEESYRDILLMFQILHNLTSKDLLDWCNGDFGSDSKESAEAGAAADAPPSVTATQVIFVALGKIMPLLTKELLEYPKLSQTYYKLMSFLSDEMDTLLATDPTLIDPILQTVRFAIKSDNLPVDIKINCLQLISAFGMKIPFRDPQECLPISTRLEQLFSVLFEFILEEVGASKDLSLRENVATALYAMILAFPNTYNQLVSELITRLAQTRPNDQELLPKLTSAFELLRVEAASSRTPSALQQLELISSGKPIDTILSRAIGKNTKIPQQRKEFRAKFDKFLIEVIGILKIK